jgi:DUF1680 family protein
MRLLPFFHNDETGVECSCGTDSVRRRDGGIISIQDSPFSKLKSVDLGSVRWTGGFWGTRFAQLKKVTLPCLYELMADPNMGHALTNLRIAAGLEEGQFEGTHWQDEWVYKWVEAAVYAYQVTQDVGLKQKIDEIIHIIGKAQQPDGYIATQITLRGWERFQKINHHEIYVMGHLITAACSHYKITGETNFLDIAKKTTDYLYHTFRTRDPKLAHFCFNPSQIMGIAELYRITRDPRYLELTNIFIDNRGSVTGGSDLNQDRIPLRQETQVVGHSVLSTYLYSGAADAYMETGDRTLVDALDLLWKDLTEKRMYVNGGIAALHRGFSVRKSPRGEYKGTDDVHEAVGDDYELPNSTAYNETCAQIGNFMWNWRMLNINTQAKHADIMEHSLYNSIISGIGLDGRSWFYTNVLRWYGAGHKLLSQDAYQRFQPGRVHVCCPSNLVRTMASLHGYMYSISAEGVWVHMYGANEFKGNLLDNSPVEWIQETNYPWDETIRLTLKKVPKDPFTIRLRIPSWADQASLTVNGDIVGTPLLPGTYAQANRRWKEGDVIELILPMRVRLLEGHPQVETTRNHLAVMRGPLLYCLESLDVPEGLSVSEIHLPGDTRLNARHDQNLLEGITVLEGEACARRSGDWTGALYREAQPRPYEKVRIKLIPYFAWCNRGISEMTVWIPQA